MMFWNWFTELMLNWLRLLLHVGVASKNPSSYSKKVKSHHYFSFVTFLWLDANKPKPPSSLLSEFPLHFKTFMNLSSIKVAFRLSRWLQRIFTCSLKSRFVRCHLFFTVETFILIVVHVILVLQTWVVEKKKKNYCCSWVFRSSLVVLLKGYFYL